MTMTKLVRVATSPLGRSLLIPAHRRIAGLRPAARPASRPRRRPRRSAVDRRPGRSARRGESLERIAEQRRRAGERLHEPLQHVVQDSSPDEAGLVVLAALAMLVTVGSAAARSVATPYGHVFETTIQEPPVLRSGKRADQLRDERRLRRQGAVARADSLIGGVSGDLGPDRSCCADATGPARQRLHAAPDPRRPPRSRSGSALRLKSRRRTTVPTGRTPIRLRARRPKVRSPSSPRRPRRTRPSARARNSCVLGRADRDADRGRSAEPGQRPDDHALRGAGVVQRGAESSPTST